MSIYQDVTDQIIASIEAGAGKWRMPWHTVGQQLRANGVPYQGVNTLLLSLSSAKHGYHARHWLTYKQATAIGAQVRRGEHGTTVVYADTFRKTTKDERGEESEETIPFLKRYHVFNCDQIDGLPVGMYQPIEATEVEDVPQSARDFIAATGARIQYGGDRACYIPSMDCILLPDVAAFESSMDYVATAAHELTHWTGAKSRLDRDLSTRFRSYAYAAEELIAELGAAFVCARLGLSSVPRQDHAQYLTIWLEVMRADSKAIFTASSKAQQAVDFLFNVPASVTL